MITEVNERLLILIRPSVIRSNAAGEASEPVYACHARYGSWEARSVEILGSSRLVSDLSETRPGLMAWIEARGMSRMFAARPLEQAVDLPEEHANIESYPTQELAGGRSIIHVNRHFISANRRDNGRRPVFTIKYRGRTQYAREVSVLGPSLLVADERQLSCGARVWMETKAPIILRDPMSFHEAKEAGAADEVCGWAAA